MTPSALPRPLTDRTPWVIIGALAALNAMLWLVAVGAFAARPALIGSALLAWLFGLRHAADADHLAAIDNVVRKLMQEGQRPYLTGLYFSLGHSAVVILACAVIALTAFSGLIDSVRDVGGIFGTLVSAGFLVAIAALNLTVLLRLLRNDPTSDIQDHILASRGLLARILHPAVRMIRRPAHMFPLGFLFGLGFDTASEVALLALSATQAAAGLSCAQVLVFPTLFTAGMALVDTADSVLMVGAYGWALRDPGRKRTYNVAITGISVALAFGIGGIEAAGLLGDQFDLRGPVFSFIAMLNDASGHIGFGVIALFLTLWAVSACLQRRRTDEH